MPDDFVTALLGKLGAPYNPENQRFLNAWVRAEGTKAAFNPLATTQTMGAPNNFNTLGGGIGVQNYPDFSTGLRATAKTLLNGRYGPIVSGLRSGSATAAQLAQAVADSPWGTGRGVLNVLGSPGAAVPASTPPPSFTQTALPSTSMPTPAPLDLSGALIGSIGQSPGAQLNAIMGAVTMRQSTPTTIPMPGSGGMSVPAPPSMQPPTAPGPPGVPATKGTSAVVDAASKWLGTPYSWGGGGPAGPSLGIEQGANTKGFDCSGLLQYAYAQEGVAIGGDTYSQWGQGQAVPKDHLRPGDAVFFEMNSRGPGHVGIYMGGDKFIEAPHTGANVRISTLSTRGDYAGARRYG